MVNKVILIGNLGADPVVTQLNGGGTVAKFTLATSEKWTNKDGQKVEDTQWHRCVVWNKLAEIVQQHVHKGDKLYLEGKLKYGDYIDKDGVKRYTADIVIDVLRMLGGKRNPNDPAAPAPVTTATTAGGGASYPASASAAALDPNKHDDLPF